MRLLHIKTLELESFFHGDVPEYAVLSHTWGSEEVTFQDLSTDLNRKKSGWAKVLGSAVMAQKHNCEYIWIDSCCTEKTSSAELSEAINSMFQWYRECKVCIVYLEDIAREPEPKITVIEVDSKPVPAPPPPRPARAFLPEARWFTRGWTLQELIAPKRSYFYDSTWNIIGDKQELLEEICDIIGIDADVICDQGLLENKSIAHRMSWASKRVTTRVEDVAYCLMGIFAVNMPLLYGEGERAFTRLQEEIMKESGDQSLFAWDCYFPLDAHDTQPPEGVGVLASHPSAFSKCANIVPYTTKLEPYTMTNQGLRIHLRILEHTLQNKPHIHLAVLAYRYKNSLAHAIAIPIMLKSIRGVSGTKLEFIRTTNEDLINVAWSMVTDLESKEVYLMVEVLPGELSNPGFLITAGYVHLVKKAIIDFAVLYIANIQNQTLPGHGMTIDQ
jgi:hypothetical protein